MTRPRVLATVVLACLAFIAATGAVQRITKVVPAAARPLRLTAVRLTGGPLKQAQDLNGAYLLSLEPDRMLAYCRERAGLAPKAEPYAGWDGDGRNLTGHIAGHYLSGVSLMWAATGDPRFKARADDIVAQLKEVQDAHGDGYLSALAGGREAFAELARGEIRSASFDLNGLWSPRAAAEFFWDRVVHHHTFATGGHGKDEYFRTPDRLGDIVDGRTAETCNIYNMLKLTRMLFAFEPDVEYAEFHERALFNHILGSIDPGDGRVCYMVPVGRGVGREYQNMTRSFTCCVGSSMESHALHGDGIYYESGDRLWVNLYASSTADWASAGVRLVMETSFPEGESAALALTLQAPRRFTLALRRPSWAGQGFAVTVNGEQVRNLPAPGAYVELTRTWNTGDEVSLVLPKALRLEPTPDHLRRAAVMWGPLVLAGDLGPAPERERGAPPPARPDVPVLVAAERPVTAWLKPVPGRPGTFRSDGVGRDRDVEFVPFYRLHRRTYAAYWDLFTPSEWEARTAEIAAEAERQRRLEAATVAFVQPGDREQESTFNRQGENTSIARVEGRTGRAGRDWFSYDLPVDASEPLALVVTYHTDQRRPRSFEILIDGQRVGEQTTPRGTEARFVDVAYPVPADLVRGKPRVTVRFQATGGHEIAAVFGIRMIRR